MKELQYLTVWRNGRLETGSIIHTESDICVKLADGIYQLSEAQAKRVKILLEMSEIDKKIQVYVLNEKPQNEQEVSATPQDIVKRGRNLYNIASEMPEAPCLEFFESDKSSEVSKQESSQPATEVPSSEQETPQPNGDKVEDVNKPETKKKKKTRKKQADQNKDADDAAPKQVHRRKKGPIIFIVLLSILIVALVSGGVYVLLQGHVDFSRLWSQFISSSSTSSAIIDSSDSETFLTEDSSVDTENPSVSSSVPKIESEPVVDVQSGTAESNTNIPAASNSSNVNSGEVKDNNSENPFEGFNPNESLDENSVQP